MALRFSNLWILMSQYKFEISSESVYDDLMCMLCNKLMVDACQTACGCQYCSKCICNYVVDNEDKYCPGGKDECKECHLVMEIDAMRNIRMNTRISKLRAICPREFCHYETELASMENHLRLCAIPESTVCRYASLGCDKMHHKNNDPLTHSEILIDWINNLKNEVDGLKEKLESSERKRVSVEERCSREMTIMTEQVSMYRGELASVKDQLKDKSTRIIALEKESRIKQDRIEALKEESLHMWQSVELKLSTVTSQIDKIEIDFRAMEDSYGTMEKNMIAIKTKHVNKSKERQSEYCDFDFKWTVKNISYCQKVVFSEPFYARDYNFDLSINLRPFGFNFWCTIIRGANDSKVIWPMKFTVVLSVLNQKTMKAYKSFSYQYDYYNKHYKMAFDRPIDERNAYSIGSTSVFSFSELNVKDHVIVNDSMVLACALRNSG